MAIGIGIDMEYWTPERHWPGHIRSGDWTPEALHTYAIRTHAHHTHTSTRPPHTRTLHTHTVEEEEEEKVEGTGLPFNKPVYVSHSSHFDTALRPAHGARPGREGGGEGGQ
jgi:hypothetical protein